MKKFVYFALTCFLVTACRSHQCNDVVKETYFHKYGVPVAKSDWDSQGKDGKVIQLNKEGVTISRTFASGKLHGETSFSFPNSSTIQFVEVYEAGILTAKRENYSSGIPMQEELFQEGELTKLTKWYEDGTPCATETYNQGALVFGEYRTPLNVIEAKVHEGKGTRMARSSEGDLLYKDTIHGGMLIERVTYWANGDPQTVIPFENGMIHGTRLTYLPGGLPNTIEQWVHGNQEGTTIVFSNGEKSSEIPYIHGKKNGIELIYRDGKFLVEEITWKNDKKHGLKKIYVDGDTKIEWYNQGEVVNRTTYERLNLPR